MQTVTNQTVLLRQVLGLIEQIRSYTGSLPPHALAVVQQRLDAIRIGNPDANIALDALRTDLRARTRL